MPVHATTIPLRADRGGPPASRRDAPPEHAPVAPPLAPEPDDTPQPSDAPAEIASAEKPPEPPRGTSRKQLIRWALFALLPLALIAGGYWYVTGGRVMSTDDAYVEADKVGISTDVSGIVKEIDVRNNQQVEAGEVLFRLDDLPFRLALERAEAQVGIVRNDLNALKANYGDMQAQIKQAQYDIEYYDREFHRSRTSPPRTSRR